MDNKIPVAVLVVTYNEEKNIARCLESVKDLVQEIHIIDSFSTDKTIEIAKRYTDKIHQHNFETHARQWNWAFSNINHSCDWVMALDADQVIPESLKNELKKLFNNLPADISGYYIKRRQFFRGKWIRFGGYYPKYLLKLFKLKYARCDERELVDHRFYIQGRVAKLKCYMIEDNKKEDDIIFWLEKHIRFVKLKSRELIEYRLIKGQWLVKPSLLGTHDQRTLWLKDAYYRMPLYIRPFIYFILRYFILLGFLDGYRGFLFHFLQAFWYRLIIDVRIDELRRK